MVKGKAQFLLGLPNKDKIMTEDYRNLYSAIIQSTVCPLCDAQKGDQCHNSSTPIYYPPHNKRYELWVEKGRPHGKMPG